MTHENERAGFHAGVAGSTDDRVRNARSEQEPVRQPIRPVEPVVTVSDARIDIASEAMAMAGEGDAGGLVTFTGFCRDEEGRLSALELEHYPGMAEQELRRIAVDAAGRWPLIAVRVAHRYGMVHPGEEIVFVACSSRHRGAAFEAASFVMDFMKTRAPFWKREHLKDGSVGTWVESRATDDVAEDRWHRM